MELKFQTLTPLWTGGAQTGNVDRIHETGLLGSIRWWFEIMVRGYGGLVGDPTSDERKGFDQEKYEKSNTTGDSKLRDAGLCDVSMIFGATGWRRRFRLEYQEIQMSQDPKVPEKIQLRSFSHNYQGKNKIPTWYLGGKDNERPQSGTFQLNLTSLDHSFDPAIIAGVLQFISDWSALGARTQFGFGIVRYLGERIDVVPLLNWLNKHIGQNSYPSLPSLQNIFLARITVPPRSNYEKTFEVKHFLRGLFRERAELRHFVMGTIHEKRIAAKIKLSLPYQIEDQCMIRLWGWIPEDDKVYGVEWSREKVVSQIHRYLKTLDKNLIWREMNSPRDTTSVRFATADDFLRSLLN